MSPVRPKVKIGDCFVIPLKNGKKAYGPYVCMDDKGPLVQVFEITTEEEVSIESLRSTVKLFPPVYVGVGHAVGTGRWRVIGSLPVQNFVHPKFRHCPGAVAPGIYHNWYIWDGTTMKYIGGLPEEYRSLETLSGWSAEALEHRILTGRWPSEDGRY